MIGALPPVVEPGFFSSQQVQVALAVGGLAAVVSAMVGVFTVIRGQSFAGHAFADIGTAGGSAAVLAGVSTLYGFVAINVVAAGVMELIGVRKPRGRDLATGIVLGAALGLAALFLYEDTVSSSTSGATVNVLFGSIFTLQPGLLPVVVGLTSATAVLVGVLYRPLLLSSVSYDLAAARGVPTRLVGTGYLLALACAVSLSAVTIGAILATALLIGPSATALRLTKRTGSAIAAAGAVGVLATWAGTLLAYDSSAWFGGTGVPVSFCVVASVFVLYLAAGIPARGRGGTAPCRQRGRAGGGGRIGVGRSAVSGLMFAAYLLHAWEAATIVAVVAGVVGFFVVLRGSAFAAHVLPNGAFAGAAGAVLIGVNAVVGLGVFSVAGAGLIAGLGRRARADVASALTIVVLLGLGDLFLSRTDEYVSEVFSLLFGEVLGVSSSQLVPTAVLAAACVAAVIVLYRPLLLSSVAPEVAEARGVRTRRMDLCFLVVMALVTTMAVPVVGSLLIFSLLIGPPAAARSFTDRPPVAMGLSVVCALATVWASIAASYETDLPVGFFVGAFSAAVYVAGRAGSGERRRRPVPAHVAVSAGPSGPGG